MYRNLTCILHVRKGTHVKKKGSDDVLTDVLSSVCLAAEADVTVLCGCAKGRHGALLTQGSTSLFLVRSNVALACLPRGSYKTTQTPTKRLPSAKTDACALHLETLY